MRESKCRQSEKGREREREREKRNELEKRMKINFIVRAGRETSLGTAMKIDFRGKRR
jgi:hypothetical protein